MIADLSDYKHDYIVQNDKLAYREQDGISFDVVYGYKTMFSYYFENEMGRISDASLKNNISSCLTCLKDYLSYSVENCGSYDSNLKDYRSTCLESIRENNRNTHWKDYLSTCLKNHLSSSSNTYHERNVKKAV